MQAKVRECGVWLRLRLNAGPVYDAQCRIGGIRGLQRCISKPYRLISPFCFTL